MVDEGNVESFDKDWLVPALDAIQSV